ncbi:MAG: hypothetical protein AAB838_01375 [Patescibacteria group bacterium]
MESLNLATMDDETRARYLEMSLSDGGVLKALGVELVAQPVEKAQVNSRKVVTEPVKK